MSAPRIELNCKIDRLSTWDLQIVVDGSPSGLVLIFALLNQISVQCIHLLFGRYSQALLRCFIVRVQLKRRIGEVIDCLVCEGLFSCFDDAGRIVPESVCIIIVVALAPV